MITKEMLERVYVQEERPMHECADVLGISVGTVYNYLKRYDIPIRPKMTEKTKQKISASLMGRPSRRVGYKLSDDTKSKISESRKGNFLKPNNNLNIFLFIFLS